jgi:hypothetical protein
MTTAQRACLVCFVGMLAGCSGSDSPSDPTEESKAAPAAADGGASRGGAPIPGTPICDDSLAILSTGQKYIVQSSDEMFDKVKALTEDNVWVVDKTACRTYFKVNKYVLRVESVYDGSGPFPNQIEAASIVGSKTSANGTWELDLAKRTRTLCIVGTSQDQFRMGGFPFGISLGALVVGSTQTYGGAASDAVLAQTHPADATRAKELWDRFRPGDQWAADITVVGHSAGSVPAEDVVVTNGGNAYLYGTPKYTDFSVVKTGTSTIGSLAYSLHITNHQGDPVSGSYRCSAAYYACKQFLHRTGAKDPDSESAACAVAKDPYCTVVLKRLDDSAAWAHHDYSDQTIHDAG